ncbi:MAG: gliding motility-associated C-terminal domain-containing protein [Bacteroidales bacterium]|jgi:gliding motility-associated-like protein|nr:gliding motility-associated C-terminal domain-containing protein [Bacteroidales bacterium]
MKKRRFVANIFAALATFAASAVSFNPVDNSTIFYKEGSSGELIFVGETDSANINLVSDKTESEIRNVLLVSGKDTSKVTGASVMIGTDKCYTLLYTLEGDEEKEKTNKSYLCYIKKTAMAPTVKVCDYDTINNLICGPDLKVKFSNLVYANSYVNSRGETVKIQDNIVLTYDDYEADGINIKDKLMEVVVIGVNNDSTLFVPKPKRHTVFKLKDKFSQYEYVSDTFRSLLPFATALLTIEGETIPHNTEKRGDEEIKFGTLEDAKTNVGNYMFSGPLTVNLELNSVDNTPADTVDARHSWKFYNDSTGILRNIYKGPFSDMTIRAISIDDYGTYFVTHTCDNSVCKDTIVTGFKVKTSYLLMPTVFTPNGDGYNDEFRPTYTSIKEYEIWIYNTMGKLMYESKDITVGWDGTHKGHEAPIGAYYYVVKAKGVDGTNYKLKGTVSIVRNADN